MQYSERKPVHNSYAMHNALNVHKWPGIMAEKFSCFIKK